MTDVPHLGIYRPTVQLSDGRRHMTITPIWASTNDGYEPRFDVRTLKRRNPSRAHEDDWRIARLATQAELCRLLVNRQRWLPSEAVKYAAQLADETITHGQQRTTGT